MHRSIKMNEDRTDNESNESQSRRDDKNTKIPEAMRVNQEVISTSEKKMSEDQRVDNEVNAYKDNVSQSRDELSKL